MVSHPCQNIDKPNSAVSKEGAKQNKNSDTFGGPSTDVDSFYWPWKLREIALSEKLIISIKICFHENIEHVHQQFVWNPCLRCTFHYSLEENWSQLHGLIFCQIFDHSYLSAMCKRACLLFANSLMCLDVSSWSLTTVKDPFLLILIIIIIIMVFSQNWRIGWCDTHIVRFCQIFHNSYLSPMRKAACLMFAN